MKSIALSDLAKTLAEWFSGSGLESATVVSSRVRLARNLAGLPFTHRSTPQQRCRIVGAVTDAAQQTELLKGGSFLSVEGLSDVDRQLLVERRLISPALSEGQGERGVVVGEGETCSVMINEEDHVRIQAILRGVDLEGAFVTASCVDDELGGLLEFAFSSEYGHLTACPTNVGTGLRASVLIHLPALVLTDDMHHIVRAVGDMGLTVRGFYGEGSEVVGNLFQISNQITLGRSEEGTLQDLGKTVKDIIEMEEKAREVLVKNARSEIEDKVWRAIGILDNARLLTSQEFMSLSSATRLGVGLGLVARPKAGVLNELMVLTQPSHLQCLAGRSLSANERDEMRAKMVRQRMLACN